MPRDGLRCMKRWVIVVLSVLVATSVAGMVGTYLLYRDTLQTAQEENLTTVAESAASNVAAYFDLQAQELDIQFSDAAVQRAVEAYGGYVEPALSALLEEYRERGGTVELRRIDEVPVTVPPRATFVLGWSYSDTLQGYELVLARPVRYEGVLLGYVCESCSLNAVYDEVLSSIQVGARGYCTVKDPSMTIVMHRLPSQLGVNTKSDRAQGHPEGNWEDLFAVQYSGEAGCQIVTSYWWDDLDAGLAKKFVAYAPAYIDGHYFVVNVVMAYDELMGPLRQMFALCTVLGAVVLGAFVVGGWQLAKSRQDARHLRRELSYEQQLHTQTQRLKLQESQIQHIDRLQTMGVVTSSFAHELKNLMTPLSIYGQMLKDEKLCDEERAEIALEVEALTERCTALLERMLAYARSRVETQEPAVFDAGAAVEEALAIVRSLCPRNVRLDIAGDEKPRLLLGDPGAVVQILLNLVTNALYAMRETGGVLGIAWGVDPDRPHTLYIRVSDTGCGMDEATRLKLFTSFFTTKGSEGTGLGMSVVQSLVQSMRGSIAVETELGVGTVFTLRFPEVAPEGER